MAAATLQQLAGDRDVFLGVGISSPAVAGHGTVPDTPTGRSRRCASSSRCCVSVFGRDRDLRRRLLLVSRFRLGVRLGEQKPKIVLAALNEQMLRLGGEIADGVLLNYLPASIVPWCVEQVRKGGDARSTPTCTAASPTATVTPTSRKDLVNYAVVDATRTICAPATGTTSPSSARWKAKDREVPWRDRRRLGRRHPDMGDADHVRGAVQEYADNGVDIPIVFALPWGEDRRAIVSETLRALA
jgi:alkanesulfonate monooxygenase SsuD/methylene tetrahydromethanopterin reductase-like flavin-dependent oxidoreductase (luciferase family)